jgi:hypothetical protein
LEIAGPAKIIMDNCVIDPAGQWFMIRGQDPANGSKMFMTNNLILRNGNMGGPNDPGIMESNQWDTLYIENNTFVSTGQSLFVGAQHRTPPNNFIWINHNTFLWHDVWLGIPFNDLNYYMTNNLFHDVSIFSQIYAWGQFFQDYPTGNTMLLDKPNRPLTNIISWLDTRPVKSLFTVEEVYPVTGWPAVEIFPLAHLSWWKENAKEIYEKAERIVMNNDFINTVPLHKLFS